MIFATKGQAKIPSSNLTIEGDKFIYNKIISELIVIDDVKYFDKENNIYIESDKIIYNSIILYETKSSISHDLQNLDNSSSLSFHSI